MHSDQAPNPYAPPSSDVEDMPAELPSGSQPEVFYPLSVGKLWVMSILTMGIYDFAFWWRNWRTIRSRGESVSVFWRTVFAAIMSFDFSNRLQAQLRASEIPYKATLNIAALLYFGVNVVQTVLSRLDTTNVTLDVLSIVLVPISTLPIVWFQRSINVLNDQRGYRGPMNTGVQVGTVIVGVVGVLLWALTFVGLFLTDEVLETLD